MLPPPGQLQLLPSLPSSVLKSISRPSAILTSNKKDLLCHHDRTVHPRDIESEAGGRFLEGVLWGVGGRGEPLIFQRGVWWLGGHLLRSAHVHTSGWFIRKLVSRSLSITWPFDRKCRKLSVSGVLRNNVRCNGSLSDCVISAGWLGRIHRQSFFYPDTLRGIMWRNSDVFSDNDIQKCRLLRGRYCVVSHKLFWRSWQSDCQTGRAFTSCILLLVACCREGGIDYSFKSGRLGLDTINVGALSVKEIMTAACVRSQLSVGVNRSYKWFYWSQGGRI